MNVLVLNGSPKGENSNTLQLAKAFCEGLAQRASAAVEYLPVYQKEIQDCTGCFACWKKTPGVCCLQDDMAQIIEKILAADILIWSFPLYYFSLPSRLKALMDRLLPMNLPFMAKDAPSGGHPSRYDLSGKRFVAISTCGFYTPQGNYAAVDAQLERLYGPGGYTALYCGEGELFRVPALKKRTALYLEEVRRAGREFAAGEIAPSTRERLAQPLYPREAFEQMADADWGVAETAPGGGGAPKDAALRFTRQMAALYNPAAWDGKDRVVEFYYTDVGETYQVLLQKGGQQVLAENFVPFTTRIETPLSLWRQIGEGKLDGRQALMQHRYTVTGDFSLMLRWDDFFGVPAESPKEKPEKKTNMALMLFPWVALWSLLSVSPVLGGAVGILVSALLPLAFLRWKPTVFEFLTIPAVCGLGLLAVLGAPVLLVLPGSYLLFGLMWTATVFRRLPLSAYYSINSYGGEREWENPLFMRTNRILTACWGVLYLLTPVWTYGLLQTPLAAWTGAVNSVLPLLLGLFTAWFQKWYPAHYAATGTGVCP